MSSRPHRATPLPGDGIGPEAALRAAAAADGPVAGGRLEAGAGVLPRQVAHLPDVRVHRPG